MGLQAFYAQNAKKVDVVEVAVSGRFLNQEGKPELWKFRALEASEEDEIRKKCQVRTKQKGGMYTSETDNNKFLTKFSAACVVYPDLKDAELQKSYGVLGEDALLNKMLTGGERAKVLEVAQSVNGYDKDMAELTEEAKN